MRPKKTPTFCLTRRRGKLCMSQCRVNKPKRRVLCIGDKSFVTKVKEQLEANVLVRMKNIHKEKVQTEAPKSHSPTSNKYFSLSESEAHRYEIDTSYSKIIDQIEKVNENKKATATSGADTSDHLKTATTKGMEYVICEVEINQHPKQIEAEQNLILDNNTNVISLSAIDNNGHLIPEKPLLSNTDSNKQPTQVEGGEINSHINTSPTFDTCLQAPEVNTNGHHLYNRLCSEAFRQIENVIESQNVKNISTSKADAGSHVQNAKAKEAEYVIGEVKINQISEQIETEQFKEKTDLILDNNNKDMFLSAFDNNGHLITEEPLLSSTDCNVQPTLVERGKINSHINTSPTLDKRLRAPKVDTNEDHLYFRLCSEAFQQIENVVEPQNVKNVSTSEADAGSHVENATAKEGEYVISEVEINQVSEQIETEQFQQETNLIFDNNNKDRLLSADADSHVQNAKAKQAEYVISEVEINQMSEQIEMEQFQQETDLIFDNNNKERLLSAIDNNGHLIPEEPLLANTDSNEQLTQVERGKVNSLINTSTSPTSDERLLAFEVETNGHHLYNMLCTEAFKQAEKVIETQIDKNISTTETETSGHLQKAKMKEIECRMDSLISLDERNQHLEHTERYVLNQKSDLMFSNGNIDRRFMLLDTINNPTTTVFSTAYNANNAEQTEIIQEKMQMREKKKGVCYALSDLEESVRDPYSDVELSEEEFVPDGTTSSSNNSISSDYSFGENGNENENINKQQCKNSTLTNKIQNVRRRLFQDINHSDIVESAKLNTLTTSLTVSHDEKRKLLPDKNPKVSKTETVANFERKDDIITMMVVRPLHEGVYKGRYLLPGTDDGICSGVILSNNSRRKHICKFETDKTFACTLHRNAINNCSLHMDQCIKLGTLMRGTELKIPGSHSTLTGLSIIEKEVPVAEKISLNLKFKKSKQHCCFYCGELNTAIARHLLNKHKNEEEVQKILRLKSGSKEKNNLLTRLRLQGDHKYNEKIDRLDPTMRIAVKNPHKHSVFNNRYCYKCEGSYGKRNFARHHRKCTGKPPTYERIIDKSTSQSKNENAFDDLIEALKMDSIGEEVMNDEAIILLAKHYATSSNPLGHRISNNRSNLRRLARLCLFVKKIDPNISCFRECLVPKRYDTLMQGIRELCQFENGTEGAEKPKLALQYGPIITKVIKCLLIKELKEKGTETHPDIETLKQMLEIHRFDFANQVTKKALILSQLRKSKKNYALPSATDLEKFTAHLAKTSETSSNYLSQYGFDFQHWRRLGESLLCQIVLFNRRRVGEASRITVDDYARRKKIDQKDYQHLSRLQIILAKKYSVMYIIGKRVRLLPVLLNSSQEKQIDVFLRFRSSAGVDGENNFLFGYPVKEGHLNASRLLPRYALESGVDQPELLRGTILRRQVATASQFLNLSDNEIQELSDFMGHDVSVHKNHYRQHTLTLEVTKISRYLSVIGDTDIQKHRGKTLDELEPYIPPEDFDNDDIYEDDDLEVNDLNFREFEKNSTNNDVYNKSPLSHSDVSNRTTENDLHATGTSEIILPTDGLELPEVTTSLEAPTTSKSPNTSKSPTRIFRRGKCEEKASHKSCTPKRHTVKELLYLVDKQGSPKMFREKKRNVLHRASWSLKEKEFIKSKFGYYLNPENPLPSKNLIKKVLASNDNQLKPTRTADNTYAFIQNQRKKKSQVV